MRRRELLFGLAASACGSVSACALRAQPTANVLHIAAVLMTPPAASYWIAFNQRLRELGYREGENLLVESLNGSEQPDRLVEKLREKIRKGVNVVVASGPDVTLKWATAATSTPDCDGRV